MAPDLPLACHGSQDALGQDGLRLKWGKGQFWSKNDKKIKVLRMGWPIVENVPTPCGIIFNLFRGSQLKSGEKIKNPSSFIKITDFPYFLI